VDLTEVARACLRRWWVPLVVVPLFVLVAGHLVADARPSWTAAATLVVVPSPGLALARDPATGEDGRAVGPGDTNPYGSPATLALLISRTVAADGALAGLPPGASATASWDGLRPSLVLLAASGADPVAARAALAAAQDAARSALADLQTDQGVPVDARFLAVAGAGPDDPGLVRPHRTRMAVVVVVAGGLAAVTLAVALDTSLVRRRSTTTPSTTPGEPR
jgi:uncharacterized protein involved in exopolysaccharide biosynthesis